MRTKYSDADIMELFAKGSSMRSIHDNFGVSNKRLSQLHALYMQTADEDFAKLRSSDVPIVKPSRCGKDACPTCYASKQVVQVDLRKLPKWLLARLVKFL